jgi:transposase
MPPAAPASAAVRAWEVPGQGEGLLVLLFPHLAGLRVDRVSGTGDAVVISASCQSASACCPRCGQESSRVHGGYSRVVADGAAGGRAVLIALRVRRFRCGQPSCPQITFAEQAAGLTSRYRRRSVPLMAMLAGFGLELAGRAAARLAGRMGVAVHPSTVLRLVAALPEPQVTAAPEVLGVDDFALRKGRVYGTVLVDVATGDVVDLLADREAATLEAWLTAHPGAAVICRDRAGAYAEGARNGAPDAAQVADRWHLWPNLAEYAGKTVAHHRACLKEPAPGEAASPPAVGEQEAEQHEQDAAGLGIPGGPDGACSTQGRLATRTEERYAAIHELLAAGESLHAISRILGLSRPTVRRSARAASPADLLAESIRESGLDPFKPHLHQRWNEGLTDATALHAELHQRGYTGSVRTVRRYLAPFRHDSAAPDPAPAAPKARQITRWLLTRPEHLTPEEQAQLAAIRGRCPHIDALAGHITSFAEMMTGRTGDRNLETWLAAVEADDSQPELRSFATGIRNDQQAVTNGLTLPYSSGKVEGAVTKIKMLKRQMYGHATFALLRTRVILHPT